MSQKNLALCPKTATAATAKLTSRNRNAVLPMPDRLTGSDSSVQFAANATVALWDRSITVRIWSARDGCVSILSQTSLLISGGCPSDQSPLAPHTHSTTHTTFSIHRPRLLISTNWHLQAEMGALRGGASTFEVCVWLALSGRTINVVTL